MNLLINAPKKAKSTILFSHGAGAPMDSDWMTLVSALFVKSNIKVIRHNFNYMEKRAKEERKFPPDRMPKLLNKVEETLNYCITKGHIQGSLFLAGKSMGARVSTNFETNKALGVICFGFPFCPPGKQDSSRIEALNNSGHKSIFINQGERDPFGGREWAKEQVFRDGITLNFLSDGDHDLKPRVKSGLTIKENLTESIKDTVRFINSLT
jgi:uncharacterized protein